MNKMECMKSFYSAAGLLSSRLWEGLGGLPDGVREQCEEIRLRTDRPLELIWAGGRYAVPGTVVTTEDLRETLRRCTGDSLHTYLPQLSRGFATARGGHRFGVCGELSCGPAGPAIRNITSINLRIARQVNGLARPLLEKLGENVPSILAVSPPGVGKTTLLRDLIAELSSRYRVAVADSRYELCAVEEGRPLFRVGSCDIMSGGETDQVIEMLTRTMSPEFIAVDELTGARELEAVERAGFSGVRFLASCHASDWKELGRRELYRPLLAGGLFQVLIFIENENGVRRYQIYREAEDEATGNDYADHIRLFGRLYYKIPDAAAPGSACVFQFGLPGAGEAPAQRYAEAGCRRSSAAR